MAPLGRDLVIACGELDGVVLGSWINVNEQPNAPEADDDSTHSSYWSAAAVWFDAWDQRVVDCVSNFNCCFQKIAVYCKRRQMGGLGQNLDH